MLRLSETFSPIGSCSICKAPVYMQKKYREGANYRRKTCEHTQARIMVQDLEYLNSLPKLTYLTFCLGMYMKRIYLESLVA